MLRKPVDDHDSIDRMGRGLAALLVSCVLVTPAYAEEPEFEHNSHFGDEKMIAGLEKMGRLKEKRKQGDELTSAELKEAASKI